MHLASRFLIVVVGTALFPSCNQYLRANTSTPPAMPPVKAVLPGAGPTGYPSSISGRKQLRLGPALVPFAHYLNHVHRILHGHFADGYIDSLKTPPRSNVYAEVEMVIDGKTGALLKNGVVISSGDPIFDAAALHATRRTFPIAPVPPLIVSPDGFVYIQWKLHEDPNFACSTYFARPLMLANPEQG